MGVATSKSILGVAVAVLLVLAEASPSAACRLYRSPETRIKSQHDAAAIVRIVKVSIGSQTASTDVQAPWQAHVAVVASAFGNPPRNDVDIGRSGFSTACDDGERPPKVGDTWVVYLWKLEKGRIVPTDSYPLSRVQAIDPRFAKFGDH